MDLKRNGLTLSVNVDSSYYPNPRDDDNLGKMICFHRRYKLGDKHDFQLTSQFDMWVENNQNKIASILPLYLYDHSGLTISTTPFHDPWDSGKIGYIYCLNEDVKKEGLDPEEDLDKINELLLSEVKDYDDWLQGTNPYYYFTIRDENDNVVDTVSGFQGKTLKEVLEQMKEYVDRKYCFLFDTMIKNENEMCL